MVIKSIITLTTGLPEDEEAIPLWKLENQVIIIVHSPRNPGSPFIKLFTAAINFVP
jgi:hypothetical protein